MVPMGDDVAAAVKGKVTAMEDAATMLVDTCKSEDMVEAVRILGGLREDKMGNMAWGGTCMLS